MAYLVDAKGKPCPTPVIMAKKAMAEGHETFTVLVDNPTAVENLKRLADNQGFTVSVREDGGAFALDFAKGEGCAACEEAVNSPRPPPEWTGRSLWAGTSSATGTGSWAPI